MASTAGHAEGHPLRREDTSRLAERIAPMPRRNGEGIEDNSPKHIGNHGRAGIEAGCAVSRILVIDSYGVYRKGLRRLIEDSIPHAEVCEANDLAAAMALFGSDARFNLILIDFNEMGGRSRRLLQDAFNVGPRTRFAVLSNSRARGDVISTLAGGFHGFMLKLQADQEIISAISDVLAGRIHVPYWFSEDGDARNDSVSRSVSRDDIPALTARQSEVLSLLALGLSNKEIARQLHISEGTTKIHTAALLRTLHARNRTEAVSKAMQVGLTWDRQPDATVSDRPAARRAGSGPCRSQRLSHRATRHGARFADRSLL